MAKIINTCPVCSEKLIATELHCAACGLTLKNTFELDEHPQHGETNFDRLNPQQTNFLLTFLRQQGNMKAVQGELGIKYHYQAKKELTEILSILGLSQPESDYEEELPMRKNFGVKTYVYPQPVFIIGTYDENGTANAMNAAWGGISESNEISICVSDDHKTTKNVLARKAFTVSMATADQVVACDYVGIVSGNDVPDKLANTGWHISRSEFVDAPLFDELPLAVECKLTNYDEATCRLVGEIINVSADESVLDENGKIDPAKLEPIVYDPVHHHYLKLGEKVGSAFQDGRKLK